MKKDGETFWCPQCNARYGTKDEIPVMLPRNTIAAESESQSFYATYKGQKHRSLSAFWQHAEAIGYQTEVVQHVARVIKEQNVAGPCLEVGCSGGLLARFLPQYVGLEFSLQALLVPGFEQFRTVNADATRLPFHSETFEFLVSVFTLEHIPRVDEVLSEMHRVLRPNGILFLAPAWHCSRINTELIPVRPYSALSWPQRFVKVMLPLLQSKPFRAFVRIPTRCMHRATRRTDESFHWRQLQPNYGPELVADQDACASIDPHEVVRFF